MKLQRKYISTALIGITIFLSACGSGGSTNIDKSENNISEANNSRTSSSTESSIQEAVKSDCPSTLDQIQLLGAVNSLNDSIDFSFKLLKSSKRMLSLSNSLLSAGSKANREYVNAMLQQSQNILVMANKIGSMSDRILIMSENIGDMADRIVETQKIQSKNIAHTQSNILQAQKNFNKFTDREERVEL